MTTKDIIKGEFRGQKMLKMYKGSEVVWPLNITPNCPQDRIVHSPSNPFHDGSEIAHFRFEDDMIDEHNNYQQLGSNNATFENGPVDRVVHFNGSGDLWFANENEMKAIVDQNNSYGGWIKMDGTTFDTNQYIFNMALGTDDPTDNFYMNESTGSAIIWYNGSWTTDQGLHFRTDKNSSPQVWYKKIDINANCWNHILVTENKDDKEYKIYVNGEYFSNIVYTGINGWDDNCNGSLGAYRHVDANASNPSALLPFFGLMDDFRIFNRELTPDEVRILYNGDELR